MRISPVISTWGFISREYRIPAHDELMGLLQNTAYEKIRLEGGTLTLPDELQFDLGAVGKGHAGDMVSELLQEHGGNFRLA